MQRRDTRRVLLGVMLALQEHVAENLPLQRHLQNMLFSHKGLRVHKKLLPFVACDRNPAILHMQIWVVH
jgi:hypothetical protein